MADLAEDVRDLMKQLDLDELERMADQLCRLLEALLDAIERLGVER